MDQPKSLPFGQMLKDATFAFGHGGILPAAVTKDLACHVMALLAELKTLDHFNRWADAVEYTETVDSLLDGFVETKDGDGKQLWLKERVVLLRDRWKRRSQLAFEMFLQFDQEYGNAIRNGYFPDLKPLYDRCVAEFPEK